MPFAAQIAQKRFLRDAIAVVSQRVKASRNQSMETNTRRLQGIRRRALVTIERITEQMSAPNNQARTDSDAGALATAIRWVKYKMGHCHRATSEIQCYIYR